MSQMIQKMTGVELRVIDRVQHVRRQNDTKLVPPPFMRIDSFTEEGIDWVLGHKLPAAAVRVSTV